MKITSRHIVLATLIGIIIYTIPFLWTHEFSDWTIFLTDFVNEILLFILIAIIAISIINRDWLIVIGSAIILILNFLFTLERHETIHFHEAISPAVAVSTLLVFIISGVTLVTIGLTRVIKRSISQASLTTLFDQTNRAFYFEYNYLTSKVHLEFTDSFMSYYSIFEKKITLSLEEFYSYIDEDDIESIKYFTNKDYQEKPMQSYFRFKFPSMEESIWIYAKSIISSGQVFRSVGFDFSETQNLINQMTEKDKQIAYNKRDLDFIINHSNDFIIKYNKDGKLDYVSESFLNFFDIDEKDITGKTYMELDRLFQIEDDSWFKDALHDGSTTTDLVKSEFKGKMYWISWHNHSVLNDEGEFEFILSIGSNLTDMMQLNEKLDFDSKHDQLTKLLNRRGLYAKASDLKKHNYTLYFIDIHHFMTVNEYYGTEAGDDLIVQIADTLKSLDKNLLITRYEGDEFILISDETVNDELLLDKLSSIQDKVYYYNEIHIPIQLHIGYAEKRKRDSLSNVVTNAALAMSRSRQLDSLRIVNYQNSMGAQLKEKIMIIQKLKNSIKNDQFQTHFQALVNRDQKTLMLESLARWSDKEIGYISPQAFFQVAKEASMIYELDYYLIIKSINTFAELVKREGISDHICSINFTMETLFQEGIIKKLADYIKDLQISTSSICIEITENTFVHNVEFLLKQIKEMRTYGFKIAIDDFGKDYSSLSLIKSLDVDYIKIDKEFIKDLDDKNSIAIIKMVIEIANIQESKVIVEGIEFEHQFQILKALGCDYFQGFYFDRPHDYLQQDKKD